MNDVAKKAGVSRGTVSNYINNVKVKEASRIKIEQAIKELGYVPNVAARELKTKTASNVVFILSLPKFLLKEMYLIDTTLSTAS